MTDISQKTWKYLHGPDDVVHLSFRSNGIPRSFSVVQYVATDEVEVNFNSNGIAVIDNDNLSIVLDEHLRSKALEQSDFISNARSLRWRDFALFCTDHPRYRSRAVDMKLDTPLPGVLVNQIQRGVMHAPSKEDDLRSSSMIRANTDPECPYDFPARTRHEMISDLFSHDCIRKDGRWCISWDTQVDGASISEKVASSDPDASDWINYYLDNPEIYFSVALDVTADFFNGCVGTWPKTDAGRYGFGAAGKENPEVICLTCIDGADMSFLSRGDLGIFLNDLNDSAVRDIWKLVRVVDHDLSYQALSLAFERELGERKYNFESQMQNMPDLASIMN